MGSEPTKSNLDLLPLDVLGIICDQLDDAAVARLASCSTACYDLVNLHHDTWHSRLVRVGLTPYKALPPMPCACVSCSARGRARSQSDGYQTHVASVYIHGVPVHPKWQLRCYEAPHDSVVATKLPVPVWAMSHGGIMILGDVDHASTCVAHAGHAGTRTSIGPGSRGKRPRAVDSPGFRSPSTALQLVRSIHMLRRMQQCLPSASFVAPGFQAPSDPAKPESTAVMSWSGFVFPDGPVHGPAGPGSTVESVLQAFRIDTTEPSLALRAIALGDFVAWLDEVSSEVAEMHPSDHWCKQYADEHKVLAAMLSVAPWVEATKVRVRLCALVGNRLTSLRARLWSRKHINLPHRHLCTRPSCWQCRLILQV